MLGLPCVKCPNWKISFSWTLFSLRLSLIYCGYVPPSASSVESSPRSLLVFSSNDNTFDSSSRRYCDFMFDNKTWITESEVCWECCLTLSRPQQMLFILWISGQDWGELNIAPYDYSTLHTTSLYIVMGNLRSTRWFYPGRLGQIISQTIRLGFLDIYYDTTRTG